MAITHTSPLCCFCYWPDGGLNFTGSNVCVSISWWAAQVATAAACSSFLQIVFSNGDFDPWSTGGVNSTAIPSLATVHIEGVGHHAGKSTSTVVAMA